MHSARITTASRFGGLLAACVFVLTGCGMSTTQHTAAPPSSTATPTPPPAPSPSPPPPPPARPFEMPLNHVDPCEVLTSSQRNQLGFDREPIPDTEGGLGDAPTCSFRNTSAKVGARLSLITTEGMNVWTSNTAQVEATPVVLEGFPGLVIKTPDLDLSCNVAVDVAKGQHLDVLYRDDGAQPPPPLDQLCTGAREVAKAAVASLRNPPETAPSESTSPGAAHSAPTD